MKTIKIIICLGAFFVSTTALAQRPTPRKNQRRIIPKSKLRAVKKTKLDEGNRGRRTVRLKFKNLILPGMNKKHKIAYELIDGIAYTQGDIMLGPEEKLDKWYGKVRGFRLPGLVSKRAKKKPSSQPMSHKKHYVE